MNVGEICNPMVVIAYKEMSVADAARVMRDKHVGCLVVVEESKEGKTVVGVLTDRDIVLSIVACDLQAQTMTVGDIMTTDLITVRGEDTFADVIGAMREQGVRRVPVVSVHGILQGIVALDDVLEILTEELDQLVRAVNREQKRETATRK